MFSCSSWGWSVSTAISSQDMHVCFDPGTMSAIDDCHLSTSIESFTTFFAACHLIHPLLNTHLALWSDTSDQGIGTILEQHVNRNWSPLVWLPWKIDTACLTRSCWWLVQLRESAISSCKFSSCNGTKSRPAQEAIVRALFHLQPYLVFDLICDVI